MFCPILIWNLFFILQWSIAFPAYIFEKLSILCFVLLIVFMLFGNSFFYVHYSETKDAIIYYQRKPSKVLIFKNIVFALPIILCCFVMYSLPLYIYGFIQLSFMLFDANHLSMSEKIYDLLKKAYLNKRENVSSKHKKERIVA